MNQVIVVMKRSVKFSSKEVHRGKQLKMSSAGSPVIEDVSSSEEDSNETQYPQTQAFVDEHQEQAELEVEQINRASTSASVEKNQAPVTDDEKEIEMPELPEEALLSQLELLWTSNLIGRILVLLTAAQTQSGRNKDLNSKRLFTKAILLWTSMLKVLVSGKKNKTLLSECSWMDFNKRLSGAKCYTTFCTLMLTPSGMSTFHTCAETVFKGPSSSLPATATTSTVSTIAPGPIAPAAVPSQPPLEEERDAIAEHFGLGTSTTRGGLISQTISKVVNGKLHTLRSPGESGSTVVKLETYPLGEVSQMDKNQVIAKLTNILLNYLLIVILTLPVVEGGPRSELLRDFLDCRPKTHDGAEANKSSIQQRKRVSRGGNDNEADTIYEWILKFSTAPILNVFDTNEWINSPWRFRNIDSPFMRQILRLVKRKYSDASLADIIQLYHNAEKVYYACPPNMAMSDYYYSGEESERILYQHLLYQYNNKEAVRRFMWDILMICERRYPKRNTVQILGEPNSGKNFCFDALIHYFCNFGQVGNFNRFSTFPLMECVNRRILFWNEPNAESSSHDTLKMLFEGTQLPVKVKFREDAVVPGTPLFILTNKDIFPNDAAFNSRMIRYKWRPNPGLKEYTKKLLPTCWLRLWARMDFVNSQGHIQEQQDPNVWNATTLDSDYYDTE